MGRAHKNRKVEGAPQHGGKSYHRAALLVTALLPLVATGGVVPGQLKQVKSLVALGPRSPGLGLAPATTTTATSRPRLRRPGAAHAAQPRLDRFKAPRLRPSLQGPRHRAPVMPRVLAIAPRPGAHNVGPTTPITIVLSKPPAPGAPMPTLQPAVEGFWSVNGVTVSFTPAVSYIPWATEHLDIPDGLASPKRSTFVVQGVGALRAQQLLAELKYLPLRFGTAPGETSLELEPMVAGFVAALPERGSFTWRYPNIPASLSALWSPGQYSAITVGAIMSFESQENLPVDGLMGPAVWRALSAAVASRSVDPQPYDYLMVSEVLPEQLVVWRNGKDIFQTPVNTGVEGANTPVGTWPVYLRFVSTAMVGTDIDGYHYDVPDVPWVSYFYGGDAVHGYWRYGWGYPQSNGCVELPVPNAQIVWPMDPLGTLVNVSD